METNKYKILVLSDLKKSASNVLKSTVSLAKMIDGNIHLFSVRKPTDIVEKDNQLSAIRTINSEYRKTEKKIQNIINPISETYGVPINYSLTFGNIKNEIKDFIDTYKPDIIVLGKSTPKAFKLIGDKITELVLKTHNGAIMIVANENTLQPNNPFSLGILNNPEQTFNIEFADNLLEHSEIPLKSFKIIEKLKVETATTTNNNTVEYVFEKSDKVMGNLSKYLSKSSVNLLFIDRKKKPSKHKTGIINTNIENAINDISISLLLSGIK